MNTLGKLLFRYKKLYFFLFENHIQKYIFVFVKVKLLKIVKELLWKFKEEKLLQEKDKNNNNQKNTFPTPLQNLTYSNALKRLRVNHVWFWMAFLFFYYPIHHFCFEFKSFISRLSFRVGDYHSKPQDFCGVWGFTLGTWKWLRDVDFKGEYDGCLRLHFNKKRSEYSP